MKSLIVQLEKGQQPKQMTFKSNTILSTGSILVSTPQLSPTLAFTEMCFLTTMIIYEYGLTCCTIIWQVQAHIFSAQRLSMQQNSAKCQGGAGQDVKLQWRSLNLNWFQIATWPKAICKTWQKKGVDCLEAFKRRTVWLEVLYEAKTDFIYVFKQ